MRLVRICINRILGISVSGNRTKSFVIEYRYLIVHCFVHHCNANLGIEVRPGANIHLVRSRILPIVYRDFQAHLQRPNVSKSRHHEVLGGQIAIVKIDQFVLWRDR